MKIAYVVGAADEPSEHFIQREARALQDLGVEVAFYSVHREAGFVCPWCVLGKHVWLSILPATWRAARRFPFGELAALRQRVWREFVGGLDLAVTYARDMRAKGIEHVHAHFATKPAAVGLMAAGVLGVPFTFSAHARDVFVEGSALRHKVAAARWVAVCNRAALGALAARIPETLRGRLELVRHGIDTARFEFSGFRAPHSPVRLFAAGRFVEKKGFWHLIEAMAHLDNCVCEIAGGGPLEPGLRAFVKRLNLETRVRLPGWLPPDEVKPKMAEADLLVVPSMVGADGDRDGVPNVLLEAAALGLPIVACDAGGIGEFVIDGETGRLVPPGDAGAIAAAVRAALADRETTVRLALAARKKVENEYNLRDNVTRLLRVFEGAGV